MHLRIVLTLSFILVTITAQCQRSGIAYYSKQSALDFDSKVKDASIQLSVNSNTVNAAINEMTYVLKFNDSLASYTEDRKLESSSINNYAKVFSGYQGPCYFDMQTGNIFRKKGKYLLSKSRNDYDWELTSEKVVINGFTCYKASTELKLQGRRGTIIRPVIAWYTPEINILAGPDGFAGLPGLIIQIEVQNVVTTLTKIEFKKIDPIVIPAKGQRMTEKEFEAYIKDLVENRDKYYDDN
jgi:GLPGLI family protein